MREAGSKIWSLIKDNFLSMLFIVAISVVFIGGISSAAGSSRDEAKIVAEDSIHRAVLSCYALEGRYPATFEYLRDNYGLNIDENKYIIHYDVFGSNIMPNITVLVR